MTLPCCENNTWASASRGTWGSSGAPGMDCRKGIIFCSKEAILIWWIRSMQRTDAKNYFSTCEYFLSATESAPLPHVTGWPCCISKKQNPSLDASSCPLVGSLLLKQLSTGALETASLNSLKASFCSWVQIHQAFLRNRRRSGSNILESTSVALIITALLIHVLVTPSWLLYSISLKFVERSKIMFVLPRSN